MSQGSTEFDPKNPAVGGVLVPVISPIDQNEQVDEPAFRAVIRRCLASGVEGIFAGGSAGMGPLFADDQWQRMMEIAYDEVGSAVVLMGGIMATSTARAIEKIRVLERIGYDYLVVTPTFYIPLQREEEFLCHFGKCREATDREMVIYNIPGCTGSSIPLHVMAEIFQRGWSRLCKESSGDREYFSQALDLAKSHGAQVFQGNEPDIAWGLSEGAVGIVPVCANYEPQTFITAYQAAQKDDGELLQRVQERILKIREVLLLGPKNWIAGIMYGVSTLGIGNGIPLCPLQEIDHIEKQQIDRLEVMDITTSERVVQDME